MYVRGEESELSSHPYQIIGPTFSELFDTNVINSFEHNIGFSNNLYKHPFLAYSTLLPVRETLPGQQLDKANI